MAEDPSRYEQIGLFRYAVIAPLLADEPGQTLKERIEQQVGRLWVLPDGSLRRIGFGTIEKWLYDYRRYGLKALQYRPRKDVGSFRGIDEAVTDRIDRFLLDHPTLRTHAVIEYHEKRQLLGEPPPSKSTLYRYIKSRRPGDNLMEEKMERRSFEAPYAGYLWQTDILYGPHLPRKLPNGRSRKHPTYLIAILDDHSRLLCHGEFYFTQDIAAYLCCLETAIRKRGMPQRIYCDNGQVFLSHQVKRIAANLGIHMLYTAVRDAPAKGKIERIFLNIRRRFLEPTLELAPPASLEKLNEAFFQWMENDYNHHVHSAFNDTPIRRFMESSSHMRKLPEDDQRLFHCQQERKVKKDGTFNLDGMRYETVPGLAGCRITVSYDLRDPARVHVSWQGKEYGKANLLDKNANLKRPRRRPKKGEKNDE